MGATTRVIIDSVRTVVAWLISLAIGWASFNLFHLVGFIFLILGIFVYNGIIDLPKLWSWAAARLQPCWSNPYDDRKMLINEWKTWIGSRKILWGFFRLLFQNWIKFQYIVSEIYSERQMFWTYAEFKTPFN